MTDKDIIKAFRLCIEGGDGSCTICPYANTPNCYQESGKDGLSLINRQKAMIERLKAEKHSLIKDEAIKEFAKRLKIHSYIVSDESQTGSINRYSVVNVNQVERLVKEMTENSFMDDKGKQGPIGICPGCGGSGDNIIWNPETDTCRCSCGWTSAETPTSIQSYEEHIMRRFTKIT